MSRTVGPSVMKADDAHDAATVGAHGWENFIDAGEQPRPSVAGGATMRQFGGGFRAGCGGGEGVATSARAVRAERRGELGASTPK